LSIYLSWEKIRLINQWAIGDWLVDGKRHYGDKLYKESARILDSEEQTLRVYKSMADTFPLLIRINNITWNHHREVSSIKKIKTLKNGKLQLSDEPDMEKMQELLAKAEKESWSVRDARKARDKRIFDLWMACYSQEEIAEKEGVHKDTVSEICRNMAKLPKSDKSYADFDLTLKGEDYDKEGAEGKRPLYFFD